MGGPSPEHEVSLNSGQEVLANLDNKKYIPYPIVIDKNNRWLLPRAESTEISASPQKTFQHSQEYWNVLNDSVAVVSEKSSIQKLAAKKPCVAFIAMHGKYGEDGTIQAILEAAGIPYTGSGVLASALGMDKPRASVVFKEAGLRVPDFEVIKHSETLFLDKLESRCSKYGWLLVIKPSNHG